MCLAVATFVAPDVRAAVVFVYVPFPHPLRLEALQLQILPHPLRN